jgi:peroxidase
MAKLNATVVAALLSLSVLLAFLAGQSFAGRYYYDKVQDKVRKEVEKAMANNPTIGPALVRLVFHDCWVNVSTYIHVEFACRKVMATSIVR